MSRIALATPGPTVIPLVQGHTMIARSSGNHVKKGFNMTGDNQSFDELIRNIDVHSCPTCGHVNNKNSIYLNLLRNAYERLRITAASCLDCPRLLHDCLGETDGSEEAKMAKKSFVGDPLCGSNDKQY